ncbi:Uma2 family endonuclease [Crocosphaera sp. XPORK-15E]|uniref:Uma2 family endonuclease n=1 Tax=Crocosphaera sp. XPORK-15E TaxID=3110247 RepID=UPI003A4D73F1
MLVTSSDTITWELLPEDFILDDEPVDNINQPSLAAALTESLELGQKLPPNCLTTTNYGICATLNGKFVIKAPDWAYIRQISVAREAIMRSYTPHRQGEIPMIVMEFLSDTEGGEYSSKRTFPPGKWFFYEQILQVPNYIIFEPNSGTLEVHRLHDSKGYELQSPDENNRYWIEEIGLFLGVWAGKRENREGNWLRWWDQEGNLLLWGTERVQKEQEAKELAQQQAIQAQQQAIQEREAKEAALKRLEALENRLREAGIDPV